jgi:hypothetical protein
MNGISTATEPFHQHEPIAKTELTALSEVEGLKQN